MTVQRLNADSAKAMAEVHAASFDKSWPALDMAVHIARDLCFGTGEPLSAFAILRCSDVDAEILTIATQPESRGQGLAADLLRAAHQILAERQLRHVFLEVAEDNEAAQRLYSRLGYQPIGRRPAYYSRPAGRVAAITYSYDLDQKEASPAPAVLLDDTR